MSAEEILQSVKTMSMSEWLQIQAGIAELIASRFSEEDKAEIRAALDEAETEIARGEGLSAKEVRRQLRLR